MTQKHGHYYKDITNLQKLDIYRIIDLYDVRDGAIQHAIKKLLLAGGRGVKDMRTDIQEAIDSLNRKLEMLNEDDVEMLDRQNDLEDKSVENIKYPLPATSLNARCYVAKVDSDSKFHQETVSCDTQSLDPKYNDVNYIKS